MRPFIKIDTHLALHLARPEFANEIFRLIDNNRYHLGKWLPWVNLTRSVTDTEKFIAESMDHNSKGTRLVTVITLDNKPIGMVSVVCFNRDNKSCDIGYWLGEGFQGKGVMTRACSALIDYLFGKKDLNKIRILTAPENKRSHLITQRLGFTKEAVLRQELLINNAFYDCFIYGLLKSEWRSPADYHN